MHFGKLVLSPISKNSVLEAVAAGRGGGQDACASSGTVQGRHKTKRLKKTCISFKRSKYSKGVEMLME